jgi:hypothetical protein
MRKETLELLTVIPIEEIRDVGIPFIQHLLEKEDLQPEVKLKLQYFWKYFEETWLGRFTPLDWNISGFETVQNRTNNALESYNNLIGKECPQSHPTKETFVQLIRRDSERNEIFMIQVRTGEQVPPKHAGCIKPTEIDVSIEYKNYKQMLSSQMAQIQHVPQELEETKQNNDAVPKSEQPRRRRGRPPGSKNKPKNV